MNNSLAPGATSAALDTPASQPAAMSKPQEFMPNPQDPQSFDATDATAAALPLVADTDFTAETAPKKRAPRKRVVIVEPTVTEFLFDSGAPLTSAAAAQDAAAQDAAAAEAASVAALPVSATPPVAQPAPPEAPPVLMQIETRRAPKPIAVAPAAPKERPAVVDLFTPERVDPTPVAAVAVPSHSDVDANAEPAASGDAAGQPDGQALAPRAEVALYKFSDVVEGRLDADEVDLAIVPPKRVLRPLPESPKLHKVLAQAGMGSRLEMEEMINEGRVAVNNVLAHIGQRIQWGDQIKINGKPIKVRIDPPPVRVLAYHKPAGEVVTHDDPQNRPTVFRRLPKLYQGKWQSVGRLDLNTEGLLLFTSSGELANKLMHPRFGLERVYAARVLGALTEPERARLLEGVQLDDGMAQFKSIENGGGDGANVWYEVTIAEGRNREVRRMFEAVGHAVSRLIRIRYGAMVLPRGLKRGVYMELDEQDVMSLGGAAGFAPRERDSEGESDGRITRGPRARRRGRDRDGRDERFAPNQNQGANRFAPRGLDSGAPAFESFDSSGAGPTGEGAAPNTREHGEQGEPQARMGRAGDGAQDRGMEPREQQRGQGAGREGGREFGRGPGLRGQQGEQRGGQQDGPRGRRTRGGQGGPVQGGQGGQGQVREFPSAQGPGAVRQPPADSQRQRGEDYDPFEFQPPPSASHESKLGFGGKGRGGKVGGASDGQPDPMQTAFGYIGADSFRRANAPGAGGKRGRPGGAGGGGGAPRTGGGGNWGGPPKGRSGGRAGGGGGRRG